MGRGLASFGLPTNCIGLPPAVRLYNPDQVFYFDSQGLQRAWTTSSKSTAAPWSATTPAATRTSTGCRSPPAGGCSAASPTTPSTSTCRLSPWTSTTSNSSAATNRHSHDHQHHRHRPQLTAPRGPRRAAVPCREPGHGRVVERTLRGLTRTVGVTTWLVCQRNSVTGELIPTLLQEMSPLDKACASRMSLALDQRRLRRGPNKLGLVEYFGRRHPDAIRPDRPASPQREIVAGRKPMQMHDGVGVHVDELAWVKDRPDPVSATTAASRCSADVGSVSTMWASGLNHDTAAESPCVLCGRHLTASKLAAAHSVAVLVRSRAGGFTYWCALLMTLALASCAFVLSFDAPCGRSRSRWACRSRSAGCGRAPSTSRSRRPRCACCR